MSSKEPPYLKCQITQEDITKLQKIFTVLEADPQAIDFLEPVDYIALNILDYPEIIKHPMDLGTVKKNLLNKVYNTFQDFLSDIDLIWKNCKTYNMHGSEIVKMCNHCEKVFKKQMEKLFKNYNSNSKKDKEKNNHNENVLSMNEKISLTEKIRILSSDGLTQVVNIITKECPKVIENIDSEKLQIKIDLLDHKTYKLLMYSIENMNKEKSSTHEKEKNK